MKQIILSLFLFFPVMALAQVQEQAPEWTGSGMMGYDSGVSPVWSIFGWLMLIWMAVWIVVGVLAAVWLWKSINK